MNNISESNLTDSFYRLTPEHVLDAVEIKNKKATGRFIILNSYENRVY
jgi:Ser/Thr protein kinase RdoA (MazF antagonist)